MNTARAILTTLLPPTASGARQGALWAHRAATGAGLLVACLALGCEAPGVGDPCSPEAVPEDGFNPSEAYIETSSVQCRTRVCVVYRLSGRPNELDEQGVPTCDPAAGDMNCADTEETRARVYCSCRCDAPGGADNLCECPDGFTCTEVLGNESAGPGVRGSYCIKSETIAPGT